MTGVSSLSVSGRYEAWVWALKRWGNDPTTSLDELPYLYDTTLPPATSRRLLRHINGALAQVDRRWEETLRSLVNAATTVSEFEQALKNSRHLLYARVQLCGLAQLPPMWRTQLSKQNKLHIADLQRQLEEHYAVAPARFGEQAAHSTQLLQLVKQYRLTRVLEDDFLHSDSLLSIIDSSF